MTDKELTPEEQERIERFLKALIKEAHKLCLALQENAPVLREDGFDVDELDQLERWYRAQHHAMVRLSRRFSNWEDTHNNIARARKLLEDIETNWPKFLDGQQKRN